jgi:peptidoglycan/LPS O-acetylase OafA/YrhL
MIHADAKPPPSSTIEPPVASIVRAYHVRGLDSIRFCCALWVYFSHFGFIPLSRAWALPRVVIGLYNNLFCGVAAVIGFFVISGFCIHYPFVGTKNFPLAEFYVRRYIRILPPLAVALLIGKLAGQNVVGFYETIIWSLVAELIYYTIYPALRNPLSRWRWTLFLAYAISFALIAMYPRALNFHQFGPALTWLVGLPSWLLGCQLAASVVSDSSGPTASPWLWRAAVWAASSFASVLRFHANLGYPLTLTLFGILAFFWIRAEIRHFRFTPPPAWAEFCGRWSYSIYLVHGMAALGFASFGFKLLPVLFWLLQTIAVLIASYCFYLAVEMPSHHLAKYCARLVRCPTP